jgi:hypothetical protein
VCVQSNLGVVMYRGEEGVVTDSLSLPAAQPPPTTLDQIKGGRAPETAQAARRQSVRSA